MAVFILTWNPALWSMSDEEYEDAVRRAAAGTAEADTWSTGQRRSGAGPGDVAFLLRQHSERGIVGSGTIASEIYEDDHWDGHGGSAWYVDVIWEHWLPIASRLETEELLTRVPGVPWNNLQASGTMVGESDATTLFELWDEHLASLPAPSPNQTRLRILGDDDAELDADFAARPMSPTTQSLTIESRGGGRNNDYIPAFELALGRAVDKGWSVVDAFLASGTVEGLSKDERRIGGSDSYPRSESGAAIATDLRKTAAQMHREPGAAGSGNATKRIEVELQHSVASRSLIEDITWSSATPSLPNWADEDVVVRMKIGEAAAADPAKRTEGLQRHARTQNALLKAVLNAGGVPRTVKGVNVDLAWRMPGESLLYVAEVKGITAGNQAGQMRLGLGQVTDFVVEATHETGLTAEAILFLSGPPTLPRWRVKAQRAGVELAWVGNLPGPLLPQA